MSLVYWDTMLFVYLIEEHPVYCSVVERVLAKQVQRRDLICTSIFTCGEALVGAHKKGNEAAARRLREHLRPPNVDLLPFTLETADHYARIRATNKVSPAEAIHLASAASAGVDLFLTDDKNLRRMIVPGIQFVAGIDVDLF